MNIKEILEKALNNYLSYIQTYRVFDWEAKVEYAKKCQSHIVNASIDIEWIKGISIMADVLETYHRELDTNIKENNSEVDINILREERKLICFLRSELQKDNA